MSSLRDRLESEKTARVANSSTFVPLAAAGGYRQLNRAGPRRLSLALVWPRCPQRRVSPCAVAESRIDCRPAGRIAPTQALADIGFLAFDPARGAQVDFSESYELMFNAYVVSAASPLRKSTDADSAGIRIAAVRGQTQQLFLSANMKNANVRVFETMPSQADLEELLLSGEVDAFGVNRQRAEDAAVGSGGKLRAMQDNFLIVEQAIVVNKGDAAKLTRIDAILAELRANGFVKAAVDRSKVAGVAAK